MNANIIELYQNLISDIQSYIFSKKNDSQDALIFSEARSSDGVINEIEIIETLIALKQTLVLRTHLKLGQLLGRESRSYVSSNCLAQMFYQAQGVPYQSPTIAAVIIPREFVKFLRELGVVFKTDPLY